MSLLNIFEKVDFDDSIIKFEYHTYLPYSTNTFNPNDEIRIPIQTNDIYIAPSESYLYLEGEINGDGVLSNNAFAFMFDEIRYELNGILIDKVRDVGITTTMKNLVSMTTSESKAAGLYGWGALNSTPITAFNKVFSACIPLKRLLGFCEDYDKIMLASKHELILFRSRNDANSFTAGAGKDAKIVIKKVEWSVPHVEVSDDVKLGLLDATNKFKSINVPFRTWDLYELPSVRQNTNETWAVKTSSSVERPRYVLVGFQTNKKNNKLVDSSLFDHCKLRSIKLFINSECYPYKTLNLKFASNFYADAYTMYMDFMRSYYGLNATQPILSYTEFKESPIFVIDCSKQQEATKLGSCNVRLEFDAEENFPANTSAYCLILHDALFQYNAFTGETKKII